MCCCLPWEQQIVCSEARTEVLGAAAALEGEERWTLDKVMAMHKEGGVTVSKMLEEPQRRLMLRKEIDKKLNDGKGALQMCYILCYVCVTCYIWCHETYGLCGVGVIVSGCMYSYNTVDLALTIRFPL
jgi:hypothetical protein